MKQLDARTTTTDQFVDAMQSNGLWRGWIITPADGGHPRASHPLLEPLADWVADECKDYRAHEAWFCEVGRESNHLLSASVHWTRRGQAAGGIRFWSYDTMDAFVRDGLRLSTGMGQKNALAGLWWGGGKGVVARRAGRDHLDRATRASLYRDYGRFLSGLRGCYIAAEDVGTTPDDMAWVFRTTRYTTCIPEMLGGSGNPSVLTAKGVVIAMEAALEHRGEGSLSGKTVAMQGLGNVAFYMIGELLQRDVARIVATDIDLAPLQKVRDNFPHDVLDVRVVSRDDTTVFEQSCDVFAPNAVGGVLNPKTIPLIAAPVVCGAANNQLENPERDAVALHERGVLYIPDFLANRMGIVNCANEQYGVYDGDESIEAHLDRKTSHGVFQRCLEVLSKAETSGNPPAVEAAHLADELSGQYHPIWGHRARAIIESLVRDDWASDSPIESE